MLYEVITFGMKFKLRTKKVSTIGGTRQAAIPKALALLITARRSRALDLVVRLFFC